MWGALRRVLNGFIVFLDGVFSLDMKKVITGLEVMMVGFRDLFTEIWGALSLVMDKWVEGASAWVTEKVQPIVAAFKSAWEDVERWFTAKWEAMAEPINRWIARVTEALTRLRQMLPGPSAPPTPDQVPDPHGFGLHRMGLIPGRGVVMGEIVVRAAAGAEVEDISYRGPVIIAPGAPVQDRGRVSPLDRA
jgi:hypothetical protein